MARWAVCLVRSHLTEQCPAPTYPLRLIALIRVLLAAAGPQYVSEFKVCLPVLL